MCLINPLLWLPRCLCPQANLLLYSEEWFINIIYKLDVQNPLDDKQKQKTKNTWYESLLTFRSISLGYASASRTSSISVSLFSPWLSWSISSSSILVSSSSSVTWPTCCKTMNLSWMRSYNLLEWNGLLARYMKLEIPYLHFISPSCWWIWR